MEKLIKKVAKKLASAQNLDAERTAVIAYGMVAIVQFLTILILSIVIGLILNTVFECILIYIVVGLLRRTTGGAHASSIGACIIVSLLSITMMSVGAKFTAQQLTFPFVIAISLVFYGICYFLVAYLAPVDNPNKPIGNPQKIKRLRVSSFLLLSICLVLSIVFVLFSTITDSKIGYSLHFALAFALLWQSLTLTPWAQRITKLLHI